MAKIKVVRSEGLPDRIDVVLITTYASKYFNPRFMETIVFHQRNGKMVVNGKVMVPLYPKSAEYYHAEIRIGYLSEYEKHRSDLKRMALDDADIFIERVLEEGDYTNYKALPIDEIPKAVIMLFREPLPPGVRVYIWHFYRNRVGQIGDSFEEDYLIEKVNPWFFFATASTISNPGDVTYRVIVDRKQVLERTYGSWGKRLTR